MNEVKIHRHFRIKFYENILLYFSSSWIGFLIPECFWKKKKKLLKVLNIGKDRIESDLNVVKIMKSIRDIKILMKNSMMSLDIRF